MDKQTVVREMKSFAGGSCFITATRFAKFIGKEKKFAYSILRGLDRIPGEKSGTKYFIPDVAQRIMEARRQ